MLRYMPVENAIDWATKRKSLVKQRDTLFDKFERNPRDLRLGLKIKSIDDEISLCTEHLRQATLGVTEEIE
jgi:hypothetical protein